MASLLSRLAEQGTGGLPHRIRLADGRMLTVVGEPGTEEFEEVFLFPGLVAPEGDDWGDEDSWELLLTAPDGDGGGSLFYEVPVTAVRTLIEEHGGEHADQDA